MRSKVWIVVVVLTLALLAVGIPVFLGTRPPVAMEVVVPNGFRGLAVVKFRKPDGTTVRVIDGRLSFVIPRAGELKVRNRNPQYGERTESVRYESGEAIPEAYLTDDRTLPAADAVVAWPLLLEGDDAGFFIGTRKERERLKQNGQ